MKRFSLRFLLLSFVIAAIGLRLMFPTDLLSTAKRNVRFVTDDMTNEQVVAALGLERRTHHFGQIGQLTVCRFNDDNCLVFMRKQSGTIHISIKHLDETHKIR